MDTESLKFFLDAKQNFNKKKKYIPLRLEKFDECGWSVIAEADFPIDTFVCEYSGNVFVIQFNFMSLK